MKSSRNLAMLVSLALTGLTSASAVAQDHANQSLVNWDQSFPLKALPIDQGRVIVWVGFTPLPVPSPDPAESATRLSFLSATTARMTMGSPGGSARDSFFDVFFAIGGTRDPLVVQMANEPSGNFNNVVFDTFMSSLPAVQMQFAVSTSGGGNGTNWVKLNPQPEVPSSKLFGPQAYGGFQFQFNQFSDLYVDLSLRDSNGNLLPIAAVPEPETYALLIAGLSLLGWVARARRQSMR